MPNTNASLLGLALGGALTALALFAGCSDCEDTGSCGERYDGPVPHCDGVFRYEDGRVCQWCPKRAADGKWSYPDGDPWYENEYNEPLLCDGGSGGGASAGGAPSAGSGGSAGASTGGDAGQGLGGRGGAGGAAGGAGGSEAVAGDSGAGGGAPACDTTQSPRLDHCVVERSAAIFVSPTGKDTSSGTITTPVRTLARALGLARSAGKAVIVCAGTYKENLSITGNAAVRIYGGFDCKADWMLADERTVLAPDTGVPLTITGAGGEVVLEGIELRAAPATSPGASSIAAIVSKSASVTLRDSRLVAGDGADGKDAEENAGFSFDPPEDLNGKSAMNELGGKALACECPAGDETTGGKGGDADPDGTGEELPGAGEKGLPDRGGGAGGDPASTDCVGGVGRNGNAAPAQDAPGKGATTYGTWTNNTWTPSDGQPGPHGAAGQGGGGGRGGKSGGGGGGGCGGCGGKGGGAGSGGGASLALVSIDSTVALEGTDLVLGKAGKGGDGAEGQEGQDGGLAGIQSDGSACPGGSGGKGSSGAPGGGGAGGISVGVLFEGEQPIVTGGEYEPGTPGEGGLGGSDTNRTQDGKPGVAEKILEL